jgi:hypothetical protein
MRERQRVTDTVWSSAFRRFGQSQRDCVLQPRVARNELPWENENKSEPTPTGLRQAPRVTDENRMAATALGLMIFAGRRPRVAPGAQPWALRRNPVGIRTQPRSANPVTTQFVRIPICRFFLRISRGIMGNVTFLGNRGKSRPYQPHQQNLQTPYLQSKDCFPQPTVQKV